MPQYKIGLKQRVQEVINSTPELAGYRNQIRLDMTREGLRIQIVDELNRPMFDSGSAVVQPYMRQILDAIGDLYLAGRPILGAYEGFKSGHALNNKLVRALLAETSAWEEVTFENGIAPSPVTYATPALAL